MHPRYNPERDGRPEHGNCSGCEALRVIQLYVSIAQKKARAGEGLIVSSPEALASVELNEATAHSSDSETEEPDNQLEDSTPRLSD